MQPDISTGCEAALHVAITKLDSYYRVLFEMLNMIPINIHLVIVTKYFNHCLIWNFLRNNLHLNNCIIQTSLKVLIIEHRFLFWTAPSKSMLISIFLDFVNCWCSNNFPSMKDLRFWSSCIVSDHSNEFSLIWGQVRVRCQKIWQNLLLLQNSHQKTKTKNIKTHQMTGLFQERNPEA